MTFRPALPALAIATVLPVVCAGDSYAVSVRRLTEQEYRNSIASVFGNEIEVRGAFEPQIRTGGLEAASTSKLSVTPVGFEAFSKMASSIAEQVTSEKLRAQLPCAPRDPKAADDGCARRILSHYGLLLFRRPLTEAELDARSALARRITERTGDFHAGIAHALSMLLQLPDFLFRIESAEKGKLDGYSRATRLSFLLWNTTPDAELLRAAGSGELLGPDGLKRQVKRLMASPRLEEGMRAFFTDMLQLNTFDTVSKDSLLYPKWGSGMAASAREETLRTVIELALRENGDVRDLMTTRRTFLDRRLAVLYRVPFSFADEWVPYEFPADSGRSGLVTQIAMLAMFSHPGRSSPTKRGVALADIFLCAPTPEPPNDVDFSLVNNSPLKTIRERLLAHASIKGCAACHMRSDPLGLALENFDTIGGYRTTENGAPIDVSVTLQNHALSGGAGVGRYLRDHPRYPECVARRLYSYSRGLPTLDVSTDDFPEAWRAFEGSGFRLRAFLENLTTRESFYSAPPLDAAPASP